MVSELVDGEQLRTILDRGRLPPRKAIDAAVQIAEGMAAAHALGIVHRDLKPENVIVRPTGQVKVLDFGLAKQNPVGVGDQAATIALTVSQPGMVMGTVGYMSPEQVRGDPADARSDIFSFGCVLCEMVSGRRAFPGTTAVDILHAILNSEPAELDPDPAKTPPALATIVRRCLEKRPEQRFQSAADLAFALRSIAGTTSGAAIGVTTLGPAAAPPPPRSKRGLVLLAVAAGAAILFIGGLVLNVRRPPHEPPRFERLTFRKGHVGTARFMPDGKNVVYVANWEGGSYRTYLASPGSPDSRDLGLPPDSRLLAISSKEEMAFEQAGMLTRSSLSGGQTRPLLDGIMAADWAPDGESMAVLRRVNGADRLEYPIGKVLLDHIALPLETLRISPDGALVAFESYANGRSVELNLVDRSGKRRSLGVVSGQTSLNSVSPLCWTPDGKEIWFRSFDSGDPQTIYAIDLKGRKRTVANLPGRVELMDISRDGEVLISMGSMHFGIVGAAPGDTEERDLSTLDLATVAGISDDGRLIATGVFGPAGGPRGSIYLRKTDGSPAVRLGDGSAYTLSPDGTWVSAFVPDDAGSRRFVLLPTGPGEEIVANVPGVEQPAVLGWLDGQQRYLVLGLGQHQCFVWDRTRGSAQPVTPPGVSGAYGVFLSPDRKKLVTYGPGNGWFVYPLDGGAAQPVQGIQDDEAPLGWRADNNSLYVRVRQVTTPTVKVGIVEISTGKRSLWKELRLTRPLDSPGDLHLHVTPDGRAYAYNYAVLQSELYVAQSLN